LPPPTFNQLPQHNYETQCIASNKGNGNFCRVMRRSNLPPYLTTVMGKKRCSACDMEFPKDSRPSVSKAFAEHVRKAHRPKMPAK